MNNIVFFHEIIETMRNTRVHFSDDREPLLELWLDASARVVEQNKVRKGEV